MDYDVQQLPTYTERQLVLVSNASSFDVIDVVTAESTKVAGAVVGGAALQSGSPWLWAPHVAIGALLVLLMVASFVRFHCKYGHKYRTGSQSFSSTLRLAPKNAWTLDKKMSATSLPRSRSGHGVTVAGTSSGLQGHRRAARPAAVIVLKPVGGGVDHATAAINMARRSVDSVGDSTTTVDEVGQPQVNTSAAGSTASVEHGKLDIDLMSTSRGSDEDWAALGLTTHASSISADPWSAIEHRQNTTKVVAETTTAVVNEQGQTDAQQTDADTSGTAATSQFGPSSFWWLEEGSNSTSTRKSDMFPSLSVFRHHQTTLQGATGVPDDTERLIDETNDKPIL